MKSRSASLCPAHTACVNVCVLTHRRGQEIKIYGLLHSMEQDISWKSAEACTPQAFNKRQGLEHSNCTHDGNWERHTANQYQYRKSPHAANATIGLHAYMFMRKHHHIIIDMSGYLKQWIHASLLHNKPEAINTSTCNSQGNSCSDRSRLIPLLSPITHCYMPGNIS